MQHAVLLRSFFSSYYDVIESLFVFVNCNYSFPSTAKSFVELTQFLLLQHGSEGLLLLGERIRTLSLPKAQLHLPQMGNECPMSLNIFILHNRVNYFFLKVGT